ncbi:OmpA family protein [Blattabacterium cuenoti]|uniref:OmpA family protein n=1 Tax=Blattabacterium cuenoti TaxID=1653831 RepID=UPI00163BDA27|nr:OmpA family protein [Blattabacterium cuenoti]
MKNVNFFIVALFTFFSFSSVYSQDSKKEEKEKEKWFIQIGLQDINYYPITSSFNPFKNFFVKTNNSFFPTISNLELKYKINKYIGFYLEGSSGMVNNIRWNLIDIPFMKLSHGINLYILPPNYKLDPYLRLGMGIHKTNGYIYRELKVSDEKFFKTKKQNFPLLDGGLGLNLWIISNFGINFQTTYNHVFVKRSIDYLNFWKHDIGLILRFGNFQSNIDPNNHDKYDNSFIPSSEKEKNFVEVEDEKEKNFVEVEDEKEKNFYDHQEDSDNDGILNEDSDNDGILNKEDLCPNQFGLRKFKGCPDTDFDNIPDYEDKCPNKFGKKENKGCPIPTPIPNVVFSPILFELGKSSLSPRYLKIIDKISEIMIHHIPDSKFYINGYADAHGKPHYNKILSIKRANSVFEALVSKGVDPSRIEIRGLGVGKKKGRRVEIITRKSSQ